MADKVFSGGRKLGPSAFRRAIQENSNMKILNVLVFIKGGIATITAETEEHGTLRCEVVAGTKQKALLIVQLYNDWYSGEEFIVNEKEKIAKKYSRHLDNNCGMVVVSNNGSLRTHGIPYSVHDLTIDSGNSLNALCRGAKSYYDKGKVFIVLRNGGGMDDVEVVEYEGENILPEPNCDGTMLGC